jgi:hypothetical protein
MDLRCHATTVGGEKKFKIHLWCYIYSNNMVTGAQDMI